MTIQPQPLTPQQQSTALQSAVQSYSSKGWTPTFVGDTQASLRRGKRPNHILHLILTILTFGIWGIVWAVLAIGMRERTVTIIVDTSGQVQIIKA